ncbi:histone acetyltransferase type B catalytic subunit [Striga asiatica]|uniref:Histone acetyltransferase type B catalytic subunit n=1 Tax=Striga asiatica TaxID=4170 RepID=A0A5A7PR92_STRAF|nr:histone acetyltransferase type B catalytic subunit [Striga asiatica]
MGSPKRSVLGKKYWWWWTGSIVWKDNLGKLPNCFDMQETQGVYTCFMGNLLRFLFAVVFLKNSSIVLHWLLFFFLNFIEGDPAWRLDGGSVRVIFLYTTKEMNSKAVFVYSN